MKEKDNVWDLKKSAFKASHALKFTAVLLVLAFTVQAWASPGLLRQQPPKYKISGQVTASDNNSIPGVNIKVKGTNNGTISDIEGRFVLEVSGNDILIVSFVGYKSQEVSVSGKSNISIKLSEDISKLDEVVVVGYGQTKRSDLTGAIASVSEGDIKKSVATSFDQALQGRVAGVTVTQNTGTPGGSVSVRIRGINTLNSDNEPLYVIDGIPMSGFSGTKSQNVLASINPSDIVSMDILKDASATAIYGSRASNGVIIITTRQGKSGKMKVQYEGSYGVQKLPTRLETLNLQEYAKFYNERAAIRGFDSQERFNDPSVLGDGTDWQNELFRSAAMQNHQLSLSGGNDNTSYTFSGGYYTQDGIALGSGFNRYTMKLRIDSKAYNWLNLGTSILAGRSKQIITTSENSLVNMALQQTPDVPVRNLDGSWGGPESNLYGTYTTNPVAEALSRENYNTGTQLIVNAYAEIKFLKNFVFRNEIGGTIDYNNSYYYQPSATYGVYSVASSGSRSSGNSTYWILKNYLTYSNKFADKHSLSVMVGHESQENSYDGLSGSRTSYVSNDVHELTNGDATTAKNSSSKSSSSLESFFGRLNYSFADKYLLTATLRADGSSKFGPDNKWGYFPSVAAAWRINKENFLSNVSQLSNLKLRLGYGEVGGQNINNGTYVSTLTSSQSGIGVGQLPYNISNPYVKWETTKAYNAGIDLGLFNNRIEFIVDAYLKKTNDLLMEANLPGYAGTSGTGSLKDPTINIGGLQNKGIEFTLNTVNVDNKSFYWKSGFVVSMNRNKLTKINGDNPIYGYGDNISANGTVLMTKSDVGNPIGQFYGYQTVGMFNKESDFYKKDAAGNILLDASNNPVKVALPDQSGKYGIKKGEIWVGDFIYKDQNNDGTIDEKDRTYLGNPEPKFEFSVSNYFTYKNFDLTIYLSGVYGNKIYNMTRSNFSNPNSNLGMLKDVLNYAKIGTIDPTVSDATLSNVYIINAGTDIPRISLTDYNDNGRTSNRFIEDGSYLRVKNIVLGYTFPKKILNKIKIDGVRIYMNVQNLYTFTKYKGYDPEVGSLRQNVLLSAIDQGRYPSQRIWTAGVNVSF